MTFRLAKEFDEVIGLDISETFIAKCHELKMKGQAEYAVSTEGELKEKKLAVVDPTIVSSAGLRYNYIISSPCLVLGPRQSDVCGRRCLSA